MADRLTSGPAYHVPVVLRLDGQLDLAALRAAVDGVVARHEALRSRVTEADGRPALLVGSPEPLPLPVLDLTGRPGQVGELRRVVASEVARPFRLEQGPPLRAALVRLASRHHVLAVTLHHLVFDGWSLGAFLAS